MNIRQKLRIVVNELINGGRIEFPHGATIVYDADKNELSQVSHDVNGHEISMPVTLDFQAFASEVAEMDEKDIVGHVFNACLKRAKV